MNNLHTISTLLHLRFPFSFFLMPVFMFALATSGNVHWWKTILSFIILHFFVFPSSNGYNSYQDQDVTSIGLLKNPPRVSSSLYYATLVLDVLAIALSVFISWVFTSLVILFILVSRAYSYRPVRLKRYPYLSFLIVSFFQGGVVYLMSFMAIGNIQSLQALPGYIVLCMGIATLFMGSIYPLTQIYQHQADKDDGVITISYKLGYTGTFVFSSLLFLAATLLIYVYFKMMDQVRFFPVFLLMMLPVVSWFLYWFVRVIRSVSQANYRNTMLMNLVTATCMNLFFLFLTLNRYERWY